MMKKITLAALALGIFSVMPLLKTDLAHSNTSAGPAGHTGSPGDGRSCATSGCHTGLTVQNQAGLISANIPSSGYVPGETYTITASVNAASVVKFGFQVSPQKENGQLVGSLIATNAAETQIVGSGKYMTHRAQGTQGSGQRTWTFNWVAPIAGTGSFAFYGSFNASNNNGSSSGDQIILSNLFVNEDVSTSASSLQNERFKIYPTPASDELFIESIHSSTDFLKIQVISLQGKKLIDTVLRPINGKYSLSLIDRHQLATGIYLLSIEGNKDRQIRQIIIRK
jgi:hypothetical protein